MLKIKDNVDLKELKKYPFESSDSARFFWYNKDCSKGIEVWFYNRQVVCDDPNNRILKMLKRDGLVEEVKIYKSKKNNYFFCYDDKDWPSRRRIEAVDLEEVKRIISNRDPDKYIELFGTVDLEEA